MGSSCACSTYQDSEAFLNEFFSSSCFLTITPSALDSILLYRIRGGKDIVSKVNLEITEETFGSIINDIITKNYHGVKGNNSNSKQMKATDDYDLLHSFLTKLYPFIDINNTVNCLIFKLLMCAFTLKASVPSNENCLYLFQILGCVNLKDKDYSLNIREIPYPQFCDSLCYYLSVLLSGYTKIIFDILTENNVEAIVQADLETNLNQIFNRNMISNYYSHKIIPNFVKTIENSKQYTTLYQYRMVYNDFEFICNENPQLLDYSKLREDFIQYARRNKKSMIPNSSA